MELGRGSPLPISVCDAVETMAIAIRNQASIKGIRKKGLQSKLLQFVDDTTPVLSDLDSARALFRSNVGWVLSEP